MLTISPIKDSCGAANYFAKEDNYYLSEVDAKENSIWWGNGADKLGLSNKKVLKDDLQNIFEGKLPNGVTIRSQKEGPIKHRPGSDLCFHAPKSVSILALDGEDKRFYEAHLEAVKETLKAIEEDCAQAKVYKGKNVSFENTQNLTVALVRHTASRLLDPHLHHHALIMNATEKQDKTWRALASTTKNTSKQVNGFLERVYKNQIYYGLIYRNSLANKVIKLGCEIEIVGKHGMWEIKGVPKEAREAMSKRRTEIEQLLKKMGYHSFKAADMASLDSREKKPQNISLAEMKQTWKDELAKAGFSSKEFLASLAKSEKNKDKNLTKGQIQKREDANLAIDTVKDATWYLSQYQLKLDYTKIIAQAMEFAIGKTTHRDIVLATDQLIKDGFLISLDKLDTIFVTKELIETEKTIMDLVDNGKNKWSDFVLKDSSFNNTISDEIKELAADILQSKHRLSLVEGNGRDGNVNKDLIGAILSLAESSGKTVRVLSTTRLHANDINENVIRNKPNNIWQWLISLGKPEIGESVAGFKHKYKEEIELPAFLLHFRQRKDVIIVNSSEALDCNDTKTILELSEKSQAKVIFLRDTTDKRRLGAGNLVETLKQAEIERFELKAPEPERARITSITPELKIIKDNNKRILQLAKEYVLKEIKDRKNTTILVGSKEQLKATNEAIRKELRAQGKISELEYSIPVLNPVYLSKPEAILAHKYQQNMVIRFYGGIPDDWSVGYCDREANTLRLVQNKRKMIWNPKKQQDKVKYGIFKKKTLQIAKGDKLLATGNMHDLGIKSGTRFTVGEISEKSRKNEKNEKSEISIELLYDTRKTRDTEEAKGTKESKTIKASLAELKNSHFQYDYATTINKFLKRPVANIIADFKAYSLDKPTINELTKRAKETLTIFTNDGEAAQKRFGHVPVKLTASEMLLGIDEKNSSADDKAGRILNDKTISEIKTDLEKVIEVLRTQYEFRSQDERKAVNFAIEKITSRNAGFSHENLVTEAIEFALKELISKQNKEVTTNDIRKAIEEKRASGELIIGKHFDDGIKWTTKGALESERSIIADLKNGVNKLGPLIDPKDLEITEENITLTNDQKNAISLITTTKDQYVIVQGYAGTGKTSIFSHIKQILKEADKNDTGQKVKILGLAPTHKAVKELKAIGIKAQTLESFLIAQKRIEKKHERQKEQKDQKNQENIANDRNEKNQKSRIDILDNKLIILDEVSMVPNKDFLEFVEITKKSRAHVVYSGDRAQHLPIGAGKPTEITQDSKILKIAFLKEIVRQRNPGLKEAVVSTINQNYSFALDKVEQENPQNHIARVNQDNDSLAFEFFKNLRKSIIEIDNEKLKPEEKPLEEMVANDFLTRTPEVQDQTVIIVHANEDRAIITEHIRNGLKRQGVIEGIGTKVSRLTAKGFTDAEHKSLKSYNIGDVIKLGKQYYHVTNLDIESRSLLLKDGSGKTRYFYPEKEVDKNNMELYSHTKEELAVGDVIRLTKTDKKRGLFANFKYQIKEVNDKQAVLESKDKDRDKEKPQIILNHRKLKDSHWDYAQTVTGYGIQGGSEKYAITFEVSYRKFLANVRSFYISISRAIDHLTVYTDNKDKFLKQLLRNKGDKHSALEVTGELEKFATTPEKTTQTAKLKEKLNTTIYTLNEIKQSLENQVEIVTERLLGKPNEKLSSSKEWRYGSKGSLVVGLTGNRRGIWKNFETGEAGHLINLLQKELGLSFPETLKYASDRFGSFQNHFSLSKASSKIDKDQSQNKNDTNNHNKNTKDNSEKSKTSEYAKKLAKEGLPIAGTIVEKYLKEHRGIKNIDSKDIRYHPKVFTSKNEKQQYLPAMLSIGRDEDGNIQCVQATYLDPKTANKADLDVKKRTYASPSGALVSLQKQENNNNGKNKNTKISFVAEGVETGLSIKDTTENIKNSEVLVTLGKSNFATINPKSIGGTVIFCLDNDGPKTFTDSTIHKAAERLIDFGKEVFINFPEQITGKMSNTQEIYEKNIKIDFNDVAKAMGVDAVKNSIDNSIPYKDWKINSEKIIATQKNEIDLEIAKKVMQQNQYALSNKSYGTLLKKPEIDLGSAARFIDLEQKSTFAKYLKAYSQDKHEQTLSPPPQRNINIEKNISLNDTQKLLSKTEKEIY